MTTTLKRRLRRASTSLVRRSRTLFERGVPAAAAADVQFDPQAPPLVLSPHWDDAVLSCWSLLSADTEVEIVNLFAGLPPQGRRGPWEAFAGLHDSRERAQGRIAEDARALSLAGRDVHNLPLQEVRQREAAEGTRLSALRRELAGAVTRASRVYAPAGIGGHVDHVLARRYARELLAHGMPVTLYAELPYCVTHGWPEWARQDGRRDEGDVDAYWQTFLRDVPEMPPLREGRVVHLDDDAAAAKLRAIGCYQLSLGLAAREMLAAGGFHAVEVAWDLEPLENSAG